MKKGFMKEAESCILNVMMFVLENQKPDIATAHINLTN